MKKVLMVLVTVAALALPLTAGGLKLGPSLLYAVEISKESSFNPENAALGDFIPGVELRADVSSLLSAHGLLLLTPRGQENEELSTVIELITSVGVYGYLGDIRLDAGIGPVFYVDTATEVPSNDSIKNMGWALKGSAEFTFSGIGLSPYFVLQTDPSFESIMDSLEHPKGYAGVSLFFGL